MPYLSVLNCGEYMIRTVWIPSVKSGIALHRNNMIHWPGDTGDGSLTLLHGPARKNGSRTAGPSSPG